MSSVKKFFQFLSSILFYSVILLLVVVFCMFLAYYVDKQIGLKKGEARSPLFGAYVIISNSMIPSINVYDAVVTVRVKEERIKVDDIITFISKEIETQGTPITHRVIGIVETDTGVAYRTKGDHNNTADFALIKHDEVLGKVILRIPMIGYLQTFMTKPIGWLFIVVIPCILIIGSDIFKLIKTPRDKSNKTNNQKLTSSSVPKSESASHVEKSLSTPENTDSSSSTNLIDSSSNTSPYSKSDSDNNIL